MKVKNLFLGSLACLAFAACSNDDDGAVKDPSAVADQQYVAVSLAMTGISNNGTRTTAWDEGNSASEFEEGTIDETTVNRAIFFFLNENNKGCANACQIDGTLLEWTETVETGTANATKKRSEAVLVISNPIETPSKIVTVLNPTDEIYALTQPSLSDLQAKFEGIGTTGTSFVMSNSVYVDGSGKVVSATDVSANIEETAEEAKNNPVVIPVERVLAGVEVDNNGKESSVQIGLDGAVETTYKVVLKNWWLDSTNPGSFLIKSLSASYGDGSETWWNDKTNYRSYWANSYQPVTPEVYSHSAYNTAAAGRKYCFENTSCAAGDVTQVVVAAEIQDGEGNAVDLIRYVGEYYTATNLKNLLVSHSAISKYTKDAVGSTPVAAADITFACNTSSSDVTVTEGGAPVSIKDYYSVVQLADGTYYKSGVVVDMATINQDLYETFGKLKYWKDGKTYFFTAIEHNTASDFASQGVVRNHLYKLKINSVTGLGTPVPDPENPIDPEKPEDDKESYLAASVELLKWRVVGQSVDLTDK